MLNLHKVSIITALSGLAVLDAVAAPTDIAASTRTERHVLRRVDAKDFTSSTREGVSSFVRIEVVVSASQFLMHLVPSPTDGDQTTMWYTYEDDQGLDPASNWQNTSERMYDEGECNITAPAEDSSSPPVWIASGMGIGGSSDTASSNDLCGKKIKLIEGGVEITGTIAGVYPSGPGWFMLPCVTAARLAGFDSVQSYLDGPRRADQEVFDFEILD